MQVTRTIHHNPERMKLRKTILMAILVTGISASWSLSAQQLVAVKNTRIRSAPERNGSTIERVAKGTLLQVLEEPQGDNPNYFRVKCNSIDSTGWVVQSAVIRIIEVPGHGSPRGYRRAEGVFGIGQVPPGYYRSAEGLSGDSLKRALHRTIRNHKTFTYREVYSILEVTDRDPGDSLNLVLLYTGRSAGRTHKDKGGQYNYEDLGFSYQDAWNREHVWPKSFGFPDEKDTAYTDVHHIRPADRTINTERNTRSFAFGTIPYADNGGTVKTDCKTGPEWTWEPPDFVKGDIARMLFYMACRYEGYMSDGELVKDLELVDSIVARGSHGPYMGILSDLLKWHELDPVDNWERRRNDVIYRQFQGNRNPFIDHPEFVRRIWGKMD